MPLAYPTLPGDIDHLIADDHAIVERQFQHLEAGLANRRVLLAQISYELALHAFAEETVLYPVWNEIGLPGQKSRALAEHQAIKELLVMIDDAEADSPAFEHALAEVITETRFHIAEEESRYLPQIRRAVGRLRMAELGKAFLAAKRRAPPAPHPRAPDEGIAAKLVGAFTRPIDRMRARARGTHKQLATDASGMLHPQAQAILDAYSALAPLPSVILEPDKARRQPGFGDAVREVSKRLGRDIAPETVGDVDDYTIPDAAGGEMTLRVYTPIDGEAKAPILIWIHGGGFVLYTIDDHYDASCRGLCNKTGAIVVAPEYRRAPEAPFPASHDDVLAAYRWTLANADRIGGDASRIAIGGESAGGNIAASTVLQLAQAGDPIPSALVLVYPLTTTQQFGESMIDAADARPLDRATLSWMAMHAFGDEPDPARDPRLELLGWSDTQLALMPPTLVITAERDVLRSQGQELARRLERCGVPTVSSYYPGTMHEFFSASAVFDLAEQAQQEAAEHLLRAFEHQPPLRKLADITAFAFERHARETHRRR